MHSLENIISLHQAAEISGYTQDYLGYLIRNGEIKGVKKGGIWFTTEKEVKDYILNQKNNSQKSAQQNKKDFLQKVTQKKLAVKELLSRPQTHNILIFTFLLFMGISSFAFAFNKTSNLPRENFSNTTKQISSSLHNGIVHPVLSFASTVSEVTKSVPDQLQSTSTSLAYGWSAFTNGLLNNIKDSVNGIKQFAVSVGNGVKFDSLSNFSNEIASSFIYSVSLFPRITNSIGSSLQGTSENLAYGWSSFANGILKNSIDGINADKQFAISLPSKIKSTYIASKDLGLNNTASVGNRITSVGDSLQSTSTSLAYGWSAFTNGLLNNITNFVNGTKLIGNSIADGWSSTKNFVASLFDKKENPLAVVPITETLPALNPSPADSVPLASSPTPTITTTIIQQISKAGLTGHTGKTGPQGPRGQKGDKGDTTDMSNYVTLTAYDRQVAGLLSSIENNVKNLSDSLSAEVDTALLKVNGNASVTGDTTLIGLLNVTGDTTLNSNAVISGTLTVLGDITGNLIGNITGSTINGLSITNNGTNTLNIAAGRSLIVNNSLTLAGTDSTTMTFPTTSATIARTDAAQTFTGAQTFSSTIEGNLHGNVTGNVTGNLTGNADTATTLKNPRTIAGVSFDGSQNINIPSTNLSDTTNIARLDATNAFSNTGNTSFAGNVGVGITNPSAYLNIKAGTASANTAPLKFTSGSLLTNPEVGALEFNNDAYYGTVTTLAIGDSYGGGVIVYILQAGDPGYVAGYQKGLIAATSDQSSGADWGCNLITIAGADGTAIGTGEQNTISIMNGCASTGIAARISGDLVLNGYSDWYLPSKDELNQVYINRAYLGVFSSNPYWTSSQSGSQSAWSQSFVTGQQDNWFGGKTDSQHSVRSIRSFSVVTRGKFAFTSDVANLYVPYTGGTTNVDLGLHNLTVDNNSLFVDSVNHKVGIGTTVPTNLLSLSGTSSRTIWMERNTTVATGGQGLTLSSGGAIAGTNNLAGGDLSLKSGISTGTGTSALHFFTTTAGSSGATDNTPTEKMTILGNGNVGIGTTNPRAALEVAGNADGAILATGTYGSGWTELNLGAGTRMLWYPQKAAFRVGYVDGTQWNNANIGIYSTAMGYNTTASGVNSIAMGYGTKASINYATAMGGNTTASGWYSTAMGDSTTASGYASMALEGSTTASGWYSTSMGNYTTASGTYSTSMGYNTTASGTYSVAMGQFTKANSFNSVAIGRNNVGGGTSDSWVATDPLFEIGNGTGTGVNAANALTVLKNGNVGIGTTSPVYTLQVNNALTTQAMLVNNTGVGSSALDFSISNVASPTALARIIATRTNRGANGDTDLTFLNYTNSALTEKMRIMDNGNVGIGTTSPGQLLEVKGNVHI